MEQNSNTISFWNLIRGNKIVIPIIQRDYAQGRLGKETLRQKFLQELKDALDNNHGQRLTLDFVYGVENSKESMYPLDGQQRLTTLWLLHWYLAYKTGRIKDDNIKQVLKRFTYETRVSSREFCEQLCEFKPHDDKCESQPEDKNMPLLDLIQQQTWFYDAWKQDPTIQSMLRMLCGTKINDKKTQVDIIDGIDELFGKYDPEVLNAYFDRLIAENSVDCPIGFHQMTIGTKEMPLSDDLYIKMNARGKPLTSFENFKADLMKWIIENISEEEAVRYASLIDNEWTDLFWKESGANITHCVDEVFFAFINRVFYNLVITKKNDDGRYILTEDNAAENADYSYFNDTKNPKDLDRKVAFESFDSYRRHISTKLLEELSTIFRNLKQLKNDNFKCAWDNDFCFIPEYEIDKDNGKPNKIVDNLDNEIYAITTINQQKRVIFYGICKFLVHKTGDEEDIKQHLSRWMRFVWNLASGTDRHGRELIRTIGQMQEAIRYIDKIENPHRVYESLAELEIEEGKTALCGRFNEEIIKAKQILHKQNHPDSLGPDEADIVEAEKHAFFRGAIRFLYLNEDNKIKWESFDEKFENAKKIFDIDGLATDYRVDSKANRIILSYCDNWYNQIASYTGNDKFIFGYTANLWLNNILLKVETYAYPIDKLLTGCNINTQPKLVDIEEKRNTAFYRLVNTNIISLLLENNYRDNYYIRWIYDGFSIYPSSEGVILTHDVRDSILNELQDNGLVSSISKTYLDSSKQRFYHGWNIKFKYKDYVFVWKYTNRIEMFDGETNLSEIVDINLYTDLYTSSSNTGNTFNDATSLIAELDRCITQYENVRQ